MPRTQSIYADLLERLALGGKSDVRRHLKDDVGIKRVPYGTILVSGERDSALHRIRGHRTFDFKVQNDL
jgi:hypothetical protein